MEDQFFDRVMEQYEFIMEDQFFEKVDKLMSITEKGVRSWNENMNYKILFSKIRRTIIKKPHLLNKQTEMGETIWMLALVNNREELTQMLLDLYYEPHIFGMVNFKLTDYNGRTCYNYLMREFWINHPISFYLIKLWIKQGIIMPLIEAHTYNSKAPQCSANMHRAIALYEMINHHQVNLVLPPEMMVMLTTCLSQHPESTLIDVRDFFYLGVVTYPNKYKKWI